MLATLGRLDVVPNVAGYLRPAVHRSCGLLREAEPVRFRFIVAENAEHSITMLCRCVRVTRSGFYDHDQPVAANLLDRQFAAEAPNQRWVSDTTEFLIGSNGKLYLAAVLDLFSRFIVGWALSAVNDRHVTIKALEMALKRRCPEIGLLHHSDQGCTTRVTITKRSLRHTALSAV